LHDKARRAGAPVTIATIWMSLGRRRAIALEALPAERRRGRPAERFALGLHVALCRLRAARTKKYGESFAKQGDSLAVLMKEQGRLPADSSSVDFIMKIAGCSSW
jgi:hypothetical protein